MTDPKLTTAVGGLGVPLGEQAVLWGE